MIKTKFMKNMMVFALTAALVAAPVMGVNATGGHGTGGHETGGHTTDPSSGSSSGSTSGSSSKSKSSSSAASATTTVGKVTVGGKVFTSTVSGQFSASNVKGVAVTSPYASVSAAMGLTKGEKAYVKVAKSSCGELALASINAAAQSLGVPTGPMIDITLGKIANGKFTNVTNISAPITFTVGVPDNFATAGYEYAVICVMPGGEVRLLHDTDSDPNTITFDTTGFGVFTLVKAPAGYFSQF